MPLLNFECLILLVPEKVMAGNFDAAFAETDVNPIREQSPRRHYRSLSTLPISTTSAFLRKRFPSRPSRRQISTTATTGEAAGPRLHNAFQCLASVKQQEPGTFQLVICALLGETMT